MTILLLSFLLVTPFIGLGYALARGSRGGRLHQRAVAVAHFGGNDLDDVVMYTHDCSALACMLLTRRLNADPELVRRVLGDAVMQLDSLQRATRLRRALAKRLPGRDRARASWPDLLLWAAGVFDADVVARLIAWRGTSGVRDLRAMTERVVERFSATVPDADEAPLVALFADELVRMGLLEQSDLESEAEPTKERTHIA